MRKRLWNELVECKFSHEYATFLLSRRRNVLKWLNIVIAFFSAGGVAGFKWASVPVISCIVILILSLTKFAQSHIIPNEKQLGDLEKVIEFYCNYFNKLEQLWLESEADAISEQVCRDKFFKLVKESTSTDKIINRIHNHPIKSIAQKAEKRTHSYFSTNH